MFLSPLLQIIQNTVSYTFRMYSVLFFSPVFMRHKPLPRQSHLWEIAVALRALQPAAWALIDAFQWTGGNKIPSPNNGHKGNLE
jgi:hypothetical protein